MQAQGLLEYQRNVYLKKVLIKCVCCFKKLIMHFGSVLFEA